MTNPLEVKVGFIGFGDQGAPMARAIAEAGFQLRVWARRVQSLDALAGVPHIVHDSPAKLGAAGNIVGVCLNVDDNVRDVMTSGGLLAAIKLGSVLVNGTGTQPTSTRKPKGPHIQGPADPRSRCLTASEEELAAGRTCSTGLSHRPGCRSLSMGFNHRSSHKEIRAASVCADLSSGVHV
jgi:hypothetical protein